MGTWEDHGNHTGGFYKCNKFDPKKKKKESDGPKDDKEEAKAELDRYLHYYTRYHNHHQAGEFAKTLLVATAERMAELQMQDSNTNWMDVQYLSDATKAVIECRNVLAYTYVFGYYLAPGPEKELFEFLQQNLEKNTDHLQELSEQPLETIMREEVVNYTRVTSTFLKNLLEGVESGLRT